MTYGVNYKPLAYAHSAIAAMNIILLEPSDCIDQTQAWLHGAAFEHCRHTLKVQVGETVQIRLLGGQLGNGIIRQINSDALLLDTTFNSAPPPKLSISLILAMPRPKVLKRVLRNAAELGVAEIILLNAYKVEKSYWQSPVINDAQRYFKEGLEQAKDCIAPTLRCEKRFKPFVEDELPALIAEHQAFVAHPDRNAPHFSELEALRPEAKHSTQAKTKRWLIVGPEGGFIPYEVEKLVACGCQPITMGPRIYRVENALSLLLQGLS
jgi:RsmE family RNA methyltransferase